MRIGSWLFYKEPVNAKMKFVAVNWNTRENLKAGQDDMNKALKSGWRINATFESEGGVIYEMFRIFGKPKNNKRKF